MMQPEEIRTGNHILYDGKPRIIYGIDPLREYEDLKCAVSLKILTKDKQFYGLDHKWLSQCKPIPLTNEILIKSGFNVATGKFQIWEDCKLTFFDEVFWIPGMYFLEDDSETWVLYHGYDEDMYWQLKRVKYLHELENIIYFLTGEELDVNL